MEDFVLLVWLLTATNEVHSGVSLQHWQRGCDGVLFSKQTSVRHSYTYCSDVCLCRHEQRDLTDIARSNISRPYFSVLPHFLVWCHSCPLNSIWGIWSVASVWAQCSRLFPEISEKKRNLLAPYVNRQRSCSCGKIKDGGEWKCSTLDGRGDAIKTSFYLCPSQLRDYFMWIIIL